jgi:hypothetical protein
MPPHDELLAALPLLSRATSQAATKSSANNHNIKLSETCEKTSKISKPQKVLMFFSYEDIGKRPKKPAP